MNVLDALRRTASPLRWHSVIVCAGLVRGGYLMSAWRGSNSLPCHGEGRTKREAMASALDFALAMARATTGDDRR